MTPFRNDDTNPFSRPSIWPKMPQTPMRVGALPRPAPPRPAEPALKVEAIAAPAEAEMAIPEPAPRPPLQRSEPQPIAAPIGPGRKRPRGRELRLTPLIAAAAVGAGGMAALFLLLGVRPAATLASAAAPPRSTLAVGDLVGEPAPASPPAALAVAAPAASSPAAAPRPAPRLALAVPARGGGPRSALPIQAQPAEPVAAPPAVVAGPAEAPLTPAAPFVPPPPPDRNAPIATHVPD